MHRNYSTHLLKKRSSFGGGFQNALKLPIGGPYIVRLQLLARAVRGLVIAATAAIEPPGRTMAAHGKRPLPAPAACPESGLSCSNNRQDRTRRLSGTLRNRWILPILQAGCTSNRLIDARARARELIIQPGFARFLNYLFLSQGSLNPESRRPCAETPSPPRRPCLANGCTDCTRRTASDCQGAAGRAGPARSM